MDIRREARALASGCHIVVGTPGRLGDHLRRGNLQPASIRVVVLDEADEMLDLGFREELEFILDATPAERRTMMFSATIPHDIAALARRYQRNALRIDTVDRSQPHADIEYRAIRVAPAEADGAVVNILRWFEAPAALVFCATRDTTKRLHARLLDRGFAAVALSGELSQADRTQALDALRLGRARVCVCTDVAARGLDLPDLTLVVHADLPTNPETLLHRSGRTGRAGRKGVSALVVPFPKRRRAEQVLNAARVHASWSPPPSADEIESRDSQRLMDDPILADPDAGEQGEVSALLERHTPGQLAAALLRLNRGRLPRPEQLSDDTPPPSAPRPVETRASTDFVQFRINVGRRDKADPKWLVPVICRRGGVTKREIGAIRIFDTDTRFEITRASAALFEQASRDTPSGEPRIEAASDRPMSPAPRPYAAKRPPQRGRHRAA